MCCKVHNLKTQNINLFWELAKSNLQCQNKCSEWSFYTDFQTHNGVIFLQIRYCKKALLEICAISVDSYNISEVLDTGHTNGDIAIFTLRNGFSFLHRMSALLYPSGANMLKISPV